MRIAYTAEMKSTNVFIVVSKAPPSPYLLITLLPSQEVPAIPHDTAFREILFVQANPYL